MDSLSLLFVSVIVVTLLGLGILVVQDYRQKHPRLPH
jgi:hypothetical protein